MIGTPALNICLELPVVISAQIGAGRRTVREVLSLAEGGLLELDTSIDAPVILHANGTPIGRGEIVLEGDKLAVQITHFEPPGATGSPRR
jgi:flagellar motor switch protein FliN/FliY